MRTSSAAAGPPSPADTVFTSDPGRTAQHTAELAEYFTREVLAGDLMICPHLDACRRSATLDRFGRHRPDVAFAAGQLSPTAAEHRSPGPRIFRATRAEVLGLARQSTTPMSVRPG